mgnify:CR=1 FL=1
MNSIDMLKQLVEKQLNEADPFMNHGMVPFVPHRQPAADTRNEPEEPREVDHLYKIAVAARRAAEELVVALDHPIYDKAYEDAFKASSCLRDALNALEGLGAVIDPDDRVVAPSEEDQPPGSAFGITNMPMTYTGDSVSENKGEDR